MINKKQIMTLKPKRIQEWRQYEKGSLLENGLALNQTASFIFSLCDGKNTVSDIIKRLGEEYQVSEDKAIKDTINCIQIMIEEGGVSG